MGDEYKLETKINQNQNENDQHVSDCSSTSTTTRRRQLDSSNIGFQLLKKHGWTEGTGLGLSQQGRLEPIEVYVKKNRKGLGAEKLINKTKEKTVQQKKSRKEKALSKRARKLLEEDKRLQEKEFQRAFFREFWPDNV